MMRLHAVLAVATVVAAEDKPVTKVVKLLEAMQKDLESEKEADAATYKKMGCWCKETVPATETSISENQQCIENKTAAVAEATGNIAKAKQQITNLENELTAEAKALAEAESQREKESTEFQDVRTELTKGITGLKAAVTVLKKHQGNFLQTNAQALERNVAGTISAAMEHMSLKMQTQGAVSPDQRTVLLKFLQQPTFAAYSSQSGQIFGILQSMLEEFEADLKEETETDSSNAAAFAELKKTKEALIKEKTEQKEKKQAYLAENEETKAAASSAKTGCEEALAADQETLADAQKSCQESEQEYADRSAARDEELAGVAKAIEYLSSEEANALFHASLAQSSFVQLRQEYEARTMQRMAVSSQLKGALQKGTGNAKTVLSLAQKIPAGVFTKIIEEINKMVKDIDAQVKNDLAKRDACVAGLTELKEKQTSLANEIEMKNAEHAKTVEEIEGLEADIKTFTEAVAELKQSMAEASRIRDEQNKEYQKSVRDATASIKILNKALEVLAAVYDKEALLQQEQKPAGFGKYEQNRSGNVVLSAIKSIIADTEKNKAVSVTAENAQQMEYEKMVKATNLAIEKNENSLNSAKEEKASKEETKLNLEKDISNLSEEKTSTDTQHDAMSQDCAFIQEQFDARREAFAQEKKALVQAKAFLKGMK